MKDEPRKSLPREFPIAPSVMEPPAPRHDKMAHSPSQQHLSVKKLDSLRIEPVVELHRSSSGRNIRLKHVPKQAAALASPHGLTPRAPERKRSCEQLPAKRATYDAHMSPSKPAKDEYRTPEIVTESASPVDNQAGSVRKTSRSKTADRRSSFSISEHVLHELGFIRSKTPELGEPNQNNDEADEIEPKPHTAALEQIVEEQEIQQQEERVRPVYQFDLWKRAGKSRALTDAISIQDAAKSPAKPSPQKPAAGRPRRGSYDGDHRLIRVLPDEQQSMQTACEMVLKLQIGQQHSKAVSPSTDSSGLSLTRSTSPTIGGSHGRSANSNSSSTGRLGVSRAPPPPAAAVRNTAPASASTTTTSVDSDQAVIVNWRQGDLIGEGTFGKVYRSFNSDTGELFALKEIEIRTSSDDQMKQVQKLGEEIALMRNLSHTNIVRYKGSHRTDRTFYIFMEYVPGGSIASLLKQFGAFSESLIRIFTRQIVEGAMYLHRMGIVHRDIKGANVLVNEQGMCKLADFGCSKQLPQIITTSLEESLRSIRGSVPWMAPEVVKQTGHGFKADIWSIGATVIEMATGRHPWPASTNSLAAMYAIATATSSPPIPDHLSSETRSFLQRCFCIDPEERATAVELSQHAFLQPR